MTANNKISSSKNDLESFKKFLDSSSDIEQNALNISYSYDITPQIYKQYRDGYMAVSPNVFSKMAGLNNETDSQTEVFKQNTYSKDQINDKYELIAGNMADSANELMLVIPNDNYINESLLFSLGIRDISDYKDYVSRLENDKEASLQSLSYDYNDFVGITYKLVLGIDYYQKNGDGYVDMSGDTRYINQLAADGWELKIAGVLRAKDANTEDTNTVWYQPELINYIVEHSSESELYREQSSNKNINIVTGEAFDGVLNTYDGICKLMGIVDINNPAVIKIYPKNVDSKDAIENAIKQYNDNCRQEGREDKVVSYQDMMKAMLDGITSVVKIISIVIIALVAISLIVSSIMIGIITYISVLERTKEIGILRAIGASKTDVKRVFLAETVIEGFIAGVLGILAALVLDFFANVIAGMVSSLKSIAVLSPVSAIVLILLSTLITVIAGIIPAGIASKKNPVESLRG